MAKSESVDAVVVGAGPAGLANAACLAERGVDYALLERDRQVGSAWRRNYLAPTGMFREIALEAPRVASAVAAALR